MIKQRPTNFFLVRRFFLRSRFSLRQGRYFRGVFRSASSMNAKGVLVVSSIDQNDRSEMQLRKGERNSLLNGNPCSSFTLSNYASRWRFFVAGG